MSLEEFKKEIDKGNLSEAYSSIIIDDVLSDEIIYEIAIGLNNETLSATTAVMLFSYIIENPKPSSKESAFRLSLMMFRIPNNTSLIVEFFTRSVMSLIHETMITLLPSEIKKEVLMLIHCWKCEYGEPPHDLSPIVDLYSVMVAEGFQFPSEKMKLQSASTPEWIDDSECYICQGKFTTFLRKHHCRNCGNVCCSKCSSKQRKLPHLLISQPSRVCDTCDDKLENHRRVPGVFGIAMNSNVTDSSFLKSPSSTSKTAKKTDSAVQTQDDFDFALKKALELSLKEAEEDKKRRLSTKPSMIYNAPTVANDKHKIETQPSSIPILSNYPVIEDIPSNSYTPATPSCPPQAFSYPTEVAEKDDPTILLSNIQDTIKQLNNKMSELQSMKKSITLNPSVQTLMKAAMGMNNGLIEITQTNHQEINRYEGYLAKIKQIEAARLAYDDMCRMHSRKLQQQKVEAEYLIRMHMEQKMHLMRQQQLEFDEYQQGLNEQRRLQFEHSKNTTTSPSLPNPEMNSQPQYMQQSPYDYQYGGVQTQLQYTYAPNPPQYPMYQQAEPNRTSTLQPQQSPNPQTSQPPKSEPPTYEELISFDKKD